MDFTLDGFNKIYERVNFINRGLQLFIIAVIIIRVVIFIIWLEGFRLSCTKKINPYQQLL